MKMNLGLIVLLMLTACSQKMDPGSAASYEVMFKYADEAERSKGWYLEGIGGGGGVDHKLRKLGVNFYVVGIHTVEEARSIYVPELEKFLEKVNRSEELKEHLYSYPVTYENVDFSLSFHQPNGERTYKPDIAFLFICKGKLYYSVKIKSEEIIPLKTAYEEPYPEAYRIVMGKKLDPNRHNYLTEPVKVAE